MYVSTMEELIIKNSVMYNENPYAKYSYFIQFEIVIIIIDFIDCCIFRMNPNTNTTYKNILNIVFGYDCLSNPPRSIFGFYGLEIEQCVFTNIRNATFRIDAGEIQKFANFLHTLKYLEAYGLDIDIQWPDKTISSDQINLYKLKANKLEYLIINNIINEVNFHNASIYENLIELTICGVNESKIIYEDSESAFPSLRILTLFRCVNEKLLNIKSLKVLILRYVPSVVEILKRIHKNIKYVKIQSEKQQIENNMIKNVDISYSIWSNNIGNIKINRNCLEKDDYYLSKILHCDEYIFSHDFSAPVYLDYNCKCDVFNYDRAYMKHIQNDIYCNKELNCSMGYRNNYVDFCHEKELILKILNRNTRFYNDMRCAWLCILSILEYLDICKYSDYYLFDYLHKIEDYYGISRQQLIKDNFNGLFINMIDAYNKFIQLGQST
jgi:hypothetical protein